VSRIGKQSNLTEEERFASDAFRNALAGVVAILYFTGFVVRYHYLDRLGLSMASASLPWYYLCVYSYDVVIREWWALLVMLAAGVVVGWLMWFQRGRPHETDTILVTCVYPGAVASFVVSFFVLASAARMAADAQVLELYGPRRELGTRVVLSKRFLDDHCGASGVRRFIAASAAERRRESLRKKRVQNRCRDTDVAELIEASQDARLILITESADDLVFFERPRVPATGAYPATSVYRIKKSDTALANTRIGP
jgi:hypothetical protein